jgi:trehalose/maltose hydrolase-like predicted phosphorylase
VFERLNGFDVESLPSGVTVFRGNTTRTNESGIADTAVIVSRTVPSTLVLSADKVERLLAVVTTTVAMPSSYDPVAAAITEYHAADGNASGLLCTHVQAWKSIWDGGSIEVVGVAEDETGRALDIQSHLRSSFYYLISSIREDWPHGALNPGGLASDNYDTVFFDMEFYMEPALLWFWTPLARAMTEFRFEGLAAAEKQAEVFGYKGAQFPWCTVSFGRSSGCCDGKGGFELCLEQHITPDVGFAMQQYFRWTGDKEWLSAIGYPIAKGVAEWIASRVALGADGAYHIEKVRALMNVHVS